MNKGIFITFEGIDGSGKTSVINKIKQFISSNHLCDQYVFTREPGGNDISESIRNIILNKKNTNMDNKTEALLYAAARRQHLIDTIIPALQNDKVVICDRFVDSSLAYQGYARNIGVDSIASINDFATDGLTPDLTFYFDIKPEVSLARIKKHRQNEVNRLDQETLSFYEKTRKQYLKLVQNEPQRIIKIDAEQSLSAVTNQVLNIMQTYLINAGNIQRER